MKRLFQPEILITYVLMVIVRLIKWCGLKIAATGGLRSDTAAWSRQWELLFIYANDMRKTKINNPEPYEDLLRLQKLDPYEAQIKSSDILKQNDKPIE